MFDRPSLTKAMGRFRERETKMREHRTDVNKGTAVTELEGGKGRKWLFL